MKRSALAATLLAHLFAIPLVAQRSGSAPAGNATGTDAFSRRVDSIVTHALAVFGTPGVSVAVVKDGRVLVARGYGVKTLGNPAPVGPDTRFGIASNTKAFTATAIAMLVEEGKLQWDAPVTRWLPAFALGDPFVTHELTVRDLLVHRSGLGLGAGDLLWWPASTYDRKEIARRLRFIPLATSFRSAYAYDNVLYLVAGELIETVSGMSWERFVEERILKRVGMTHSTVSHSDASGTDDVATTHAVVEGALRVIAPMTSNNTNPAGGINAGANDIARWLQVQLDSGKLADGSRLFAARSTRQLWTMVTPIPFGTPPVELAPLQVHFNGYALGFQTNDFRGRQLVWHTGGLPGYLSFVGMLPGERIGVAVFTNAETNSFMALGWQLLDAALGDAVPVRHDWIAGYKRLALRSDSALKAQRSSAGSARDSSRGPSLALDRYAGSYEDPWYGTVSIARDAKGLVIRFDHTPQLVGDMVHWQYDTFLVRWRDRELRADAFVTFALTPDGKIDMARMYPESSEVDFSFDFADLRLRPVRK